MPELRTMSNYPKGFRTGLNVRGLPILNTYGGNVFWVDSGGSGGDNGNGTYQRPFKTIDYAIGRCTASNGDVIVCKAGHAETLTAASAITCDIAGVTIIAASGAVGALRPKLTFASTDNTASVVVSADNVSIIGLLGVGGDDGLTAAFVVTGDNPYIDIEWQDASAAVEAACAVQFNTANNIRCVLKYNGFIAGNACLNAIQLIDCDNVEIDVDAYGEFSTGIVEMLTAASTNVVVRGYFYNDNVALTKNVVNTGGLACTWFASGYDGKGGYSFSGGSATALAADDTSSVASQATSIATGVVSLGTQVTGVASQATSIATGTVSVGAQVLSAATSIGTGTSVINSQAISIATGAVSLGTQVTGVASQATSIATGVVSVGTQTTAVASQATSIATGVVSVGTQATAVASQATSIATGTVSVGAQVLSSATSVGIATSVLKSTCDAILSIVTSKP